MSHFFVSDARSSEAGAKQIGEKLRALGYDVWRDCWRAAGAEAMMGERQTDQPELFYGVQPGAARAFGSPAAVDRSVRGSG